MASRSNRGFGTQSMPELIPHRGAHMTGQVKGHNSTEDFYVPRANWTETHDSPMKHRSLLFDHGQFLSFQGMKDSQKATQRQMHTRELNRQMEEVVRSRQAEKEEKEHTLRLTIKEAENKDDGDNQEKANEIEKKRTLKARLDETTAEKAQRAKEDRLYRQREGEELRQRTMMQLYAEMQATARRKEIMKHEAIETQQQLEFDKRAKREERLREEEMVRHAMAQEVAGEEARLQAQSNRIKDAMTEQENNYRRYEETAGKHMAMRRDHEVRRQDRDEKIHMARVQMYYAQREAARQRQQQKTNETLSFQVEDAHVRRVAERAGEAAERKVNEAAARSVLEEELAKERHRKQVQASYAKEILSAAEDKRRQYEKEAQLDFVRPKIRPDETLKQSMDASRGVDKPCGKPEGFPRADHEGRLGRHSRPVRSSRGEPPMKDLSASAARLAKQAAEPKEKWSRGLTDQDLRGAKKEAAKRASVKAADNSVTMGHVS